MIASSIPVASMLSFTTETTQERRHLRLLRILDLGTYSLGPQWWVAVHVCGDMVESRMEKAQARDSNGGASVLYTCAHTDAYVHGQKHDQMTNLSAYPQTSIPTTLPTHIARVEEMTVAWEMKVV